MNTKMEAAYHSSLITDSSCIQEVSNSQLNVQTQIFDDGHKPGQTTSPTTLTLHSGKQSSNFVAVFDHCLPEIWCSRSYIYSIERVKPWGVFISTKDALNSSIDPEDLWNLGEFEKSIALVTLRSHIFGKCKDIIGKDLDHIYGTVVWSLASGLSNEVQYHIDYAELYRYESNNICPPLYAGTCQVSPLNTEEVVGGDFMVNIGGLNHYRKFGYKAKFVTDEMLQTDLNSSDWITIKYRENRGIIHDGDLPHLSTRIKYIHGTKKRVILGFNCFTKAVGPCCERAPEHSDAFNRTIKLYQAMSTLVQPVSSSENDSDKMLKEENIRSDYNIGITTKDILKNKALARLIVMAAKKVNEKNDK